MRFYDKAKSQQIKTAEKRALLEVKISNYLYLVPNFINHALLKEL
jgi:hypothetical protein